MMTENKTTATAVLLTANVPNARGVAHTTEDLKRLADRYPEKLSFDEATGQLSSAIEIQDEQHLQRLMMSVQYGITRVAAEERQQQIRDTMAPKCSNRVVEERDSGFVLYCYHPQWGGYGGYAEVEFSRFSGCNQGGPGCFELSVWHDGDFPTDEPVFFRHCCDAGQFLRFGLDVLEAQLQHQLQQQTDAPVVLSEIDTQQLLRYRERLDELLRKHSSATPQGDAAVLEEELRRVYARIERIVRDPVVDRCAEVRLAALLQEKPDYLD